MPYAHITGWGMSVPQKVMTNDDLSKIIDTNDEWIRDRTGIRQRHIASGTETTSSLGTDAAFKALKVAGLIPDDLDLIICSTSTPEYIFPATACLIQDRLGANKAGAFDLSAACSGFIYAMNMGAQSIRSGSVKTVLVIGTETLSRFVNWQDRSTCILFGDGAGAFILQASEKPGGIQGAVMHSDGSGGDYLSIPAGGSAHPASEITIHTGMHFIHMDGKEVYRFATRVMAHATTEVAEKSGWKVEDLSLIIPHQANSRIIDAAARALKLPLEKFMVNVDRYGNTSTASIPIATVEAIQNKRLKPGDKVVFVGFGAGLTWGALAAEWSGPLPSEHYITAEWYKPWARVRSILRRILRILDGIFFGRDA
ncbi:MAG: ketoacyl-ACP synthase III [Chloroflexi bacterium]|nr:ketoacyl-ACP synthase III [Chloroflexota bacterium]